MSNSFARRLAAASACAAAACAGLAACTTTLPTYRAPRADAPICTAAAAIAAAELAPGSCARLAWHAVPGLAASSENSAQLLCRAEGLDGRAATAFCDYARRASVVDKRQELAQLLACGRDEQVMVEDLWRFGEERYEGAEILALNGRPLRVRWRGGQPEAGPTVQEILLDTATTTDAPGCGFETEGLR